MGELVEWFQQEMTNPTMHIISFIAELHHRFVVIHPFDDGNGRVARLWTNYVLLQKGFPPLIIRSEDKNNYFAALNQADVGNLDKFAIYLGRILIDWLEISIKAAKGEEISDMSDINKDIDHFANSLKLRGPAFFSRNDWLRIYEDYFHPIYDKVSSALAGFEKNFGKKTEHFDREYEQFGRESSEQGVFAENRLKGKKSASFTIGIGDENIFLKFSVNEEKTKYHLQMLTGKGMILFEDNYPLDRPLTQDELSNIALKFSKSFLGYLKCELKETKR